MQISTAELASFEMKLPYLFNLAVVIGTLRVSCILHSHCRCASSGLLVDMVCCFEAPCQGIQQMALRSHLTVPCPYRVTVSKQ